MAWAPDRVFGACVVDLGDGSGLWGGTTPTLSGVGSGRAPWQRLRGYEVGLANEMWSATRAEYDPGAAIDLLGLSLKALPPAPRLARS